MVIQSENVQKSFIEDTPDMDTVTNEDSKLCEKIGTDFTYKHKFVWANLIGYTVYHIFGIVGAFLYLTFQIKFLSIIYTFSYFMWGGVSITMGAHRYFTHRAFKVTPTLRRLLIILFIIIGEGTLWEWVRIHRQHHKYSDTDADPHNAKRGFFFSHIGWILCHKHPKIKEYGKQIDMSDISADPWIMFQKKYFAILYLVLCVFIPTIIPIVLWNEDPVKSLLVCYFGRTCFMLNATFSVNSFAHAFGSKPYDKSIVAVENKYVSFVSNGEGYHNYHHVFPWDYRASEFGMPLNFTTFVINWCAKKGWVYDLKAASEESIKNRMEKTGETSQ